MTGDEASAIAEKVQYHIARIHPEELYIRSEKSEESTAVGSVHQADEVDAVSYDNGAWIQIVADDGTEGYINAYYADYLTCYPVAETLEEEQDRLRNQADTSETGEGSGQAPSMAWRKRQSIRSRFPMIVKAVLIPALWLPEAEMTAIRRAAIAMTAVILRKIQTLRQRTEVRITVQIPPGMKAGTTAQLRRTETIASRITLI